MNESNPFDLLLDIERRCQQNAAALPTAVDAEDKWVGVGFRIGKDRLIASMSEVQEILDLPEFTKVPGVKSWVVGVANVRGSLLPIMDLKGFILGEDVRQRKKGRVIVIDYKGFSTGLVVDEVYGMRHFLEKERVEEAPEVHDNISQYVENSFKQDNESWPVFSFGNVVRDEQFSHASL
ncbi:MAG: chemotaxis protein CheW [Gammaproteobacteria bacterium]|nr:chemotaxis protein CheW [Gammaproteobacteria bacterium]